MEDKRRSYLDAILRHVSFDGWGRRAVKNAAIDLEEEEEAIWQCFPGGALAMVSTFNTFADEEMVKSLSKYDLGSLKIRERVSLAVRLRIEAIANHREAVRRSIALYSLPFNAPSALRSLYNTVDNIWVGIGDTSTDFNFYTKRGLLAGVYSSTMLYWMDDSSEDSAETWAFLDRRISDVMRIQKARSNFDHVSTCIRGVSASLRKKAGLSKYFV